MIRTSSHKPWITATALMLALAAALLAVGLVAMGLLGPDKAETADPPALGVAALVAERASGYDLRRVFSGRVEARRSSALGFERGGLLAGVLVDEGDSVEAGQVLARLDTALLAAGRREQAAALAAAEADQALAESTLERYRDSVDQGAVTRQALDEATEGARAAAAQVALARARLDSVDLDLAKSELRAPFAGTVVRRDADEGRVLAAGSPVLEVQEAALPEVRVGIAGPLADLLKLGDEYRLSWRGRTFGARLQALLPIRAAGARTLDALFMPTAPPADLRPGDLVELALDEHLDEPGIWLPLSALAEGTRGLWSVYGLESLPRTADAPSTNPSAADHRIVPIPVELIHQAGDQVYVRGPVPDGGLLVRNGLHRVLPGQLVRLLHDDAGRIAMEGR